MVWLVWDGRERGGREKKREKGKKGTNLVVEESSVHDAGLAL